MSEPKSEQVEPYLEGNPWIVVLALSLMPVFVLLGQLAGYPGAILFALIGLLSIIPADIFAIRTRKKTQWTPLSAICAFLLVAVQFGFVATLLRN